MIIRRTNLNGEINDIVSALQKRRDKINHEIMLLYFKMNEISADDILENNSLANIKHEKIIENIKQKFMEINSINARLNYYRKKIIEKIH